MPEGAGLMGQGFNQRRMTMAQCTDGDAAGEVDVFLTLSIRHNSATALYRNDLKGRIVRHHVLVKLGSYWVHGLVPKTHDLPSPILGNGG